jgi:hypothetical protein
MSLFAGGSWGRAHVSRPEGEADRSPRRASRPPRRLSRSSACGSSRCRTQRPRAGVFGRHATRGGSVQLVWPSPHTDTDCPGADWKSSALLGDAQMSLERHGRDPLAATYVPTSTCAVASGAIRSEAWPGAGPRLPSLELPSGDCPRPRPAARASCSGTASSSAPRRCASLISRAAQPTP